MKAICIKEPTYIDGVKTLEFTKGKTYDFKKLSIVYVTTDDKGRRETFFDITRLFEVIKD